MEANNVQAIMGDKKKNNAKDTAIASHVKKVKENTNKWYIRVFFITLW